MTVKERTSISGIDLSMGEDDICHIADDRKTPLVGLCGSPYDCPGGKDSTPYRGQGVCTDCGREVCPECAQRSRRLRDDGE